MEFQYIFLFAIVFIVVAIFAFIKINSKQNQAWKRKVLTEIAKLTPQIQSGDNILMKSALIEIDKVFDYAMKNRFIKGESMGERLKNAEKYFDKKFYNNIWESHKLRNKFAHELNFQAHKEDILNAFQTLSRATSKLCS